MKPKEHFVFALKRFGEGTVKTINRNFEIYNALWIQVPSEHILWAFGYIFWAKKDANPSQYDLSQRVPLNEFDLCFMSSSEASYGHYLTQAQLTERIGISTSASEMAAKSLKKAMKVLGATANTSEAGPQIVSHRDAVLMTLHDFRMTYQLGQALTENLAHIWPKNVHMLVTPPMPDGFCNSLGEKECKRTTPCKWKVSKYSPESFASKNHSHKPRKSTCSGNFAGWICWREVLTGLRSEAQWHCFEPANFKGVEPSNSSQEERFLAPKLNV